MKIIGKLLVVLCHEFHSLFFFFFFLSSCNSYRMVYNSSFLLIGSCLNIILIHGIVTWPKFSNSWYPFSDLVRKTLFLPWRESTVKRCKIQHSIRIWLIAMQTVLQWIQWRANILIDSLPVIKASHPIYTYIHIYFYSFSLCLTESPVINITSELSASVPFFFPLFSIYLSSVCSRIFVETADKIK